MNQTLNTSVIFIDKKYHYDSALYCADSIINLAINQTEACPQ